MVIISNNKNMNIYLKLAFTSSFFCIFSTIVYIIFLPFSAKSLNPMLKSFSNVPLSLLLAVKFIEFILYFMINYVYDIFLLIFISRVPWLYISFLLFPFPLWIILILLFFDIYSLFGPFYLISNERYALFRDKGPFKCPMRSKQDGVLGILLSALISSICSIIVYVVSKLSLIPLSSAYFETKHFIAPIPLPILMVAFFPLGFCIQKIILSLGPFKSYLYMILSMAWVTSSYLYLFIQNITFHAIWVSILTFWFSITISFLLMILCTKS
ncbi:hypothetical protein T552_00143 [Pneumocystis carinii B80]|uniref:Uncharacterized protein n=1 Tax=Pneumocystis carinii (strain B80) TaxID=1408658 RepID=A0A0W4ZSZ1_PNEC8|nr:hypothetical protein T552_00143 [Pneumocystis carinii B80]KTW31501.1 hypothetical protein T552_00143 [Pneumocystis carinii B80]